MRYLFFDLEFASQFDNITRICEFGYVLCDESFNILEKDNLVINPNIPYSVWDQRVVKTILTRTIEEYESCPKFDYYFNKIKELITTSDFVVGHTISGDVKGINDELKRYNFESLDYAFVDVKEFYKAYKNHSFATSVTNILNELHIEGDANTHDAMSDAYNTMLECKEILHLMDVSLKEMITLAPDAIDHTTNYLIDSVEFNKLLTKEELDNNLLGDGTNNLVHKTLNYERFKQFIDNCKVNKKVPKLLHKERISISLNYEETHYKEMLNLVQIIKNYGGNFITKTSGCTIFIKDDNSTIDNDTRYKVITNQINSGAVIKIKSLEEFLNDLNISLDNFNKLPMVSFDFLYDDETIIKNKSLKRKIEKVKNQEIENQEVVSDKTSLGDLFSDFFKDE